MVDGHIDVVNGLGWDDIEGLLTKAYIGEGVDYHSWGGVIGSYHRGLESDARRIDIGDAEDVVSACWEQFL